MGYLRIACNNSFRNYGNPPFFPRKSTSAPDSSKTILILLRNFSQSINQSYRVIPFVSCPYLWENNANFRAVLFCAPRTPKNRTAVKAQTDKIPCDLSRARYPAS
jgi:hypothetical protein